jgi:hypothetical protein
MAGAVSSSRVDGGKCAGVQIQFSAGRSASTEGSQKIAGERGIG